MEGGKGTAEDIGFSRHSSQNAGYVRPGLFLHRSEVIYVISNMTVSSHLYD